MWSALIGKASDCVPKFNDDLLLGFRERKIEEIPGYLDGLFKQSIVTLDVHFNKQGTADANRLRYIGYVELTPDERMAYHRSAQDNYKRWFDIRPTNIKIIRFDFDYGGTVYNMYIHVPILVEHALLVRGVSYYPQLAIVGKGGIHRKKDEITMHLQRANIRFYRDKPIAFRTMDGRLFREANITTKIHQKYKRRPPLIIYHLAKYGFSAFTKMYGMEQQLFLTDTTDNAADDTYAYVEIKPNIFIKVANEALSDNNVVRVIVSLLHIFKFMPEFMHSHEIMSSNYYKVALGKWTSKPTVTKREMRHGQAEYHLQMNESLLDPAAIRQHLSVGIDAPSVDELLLQAFFNLDAWLASTKYQGADLYQKKIGALDQMMAGLVQAFNLKLFKHIINEQVGLTPESVKKLMYAAKSDKWVTGSAMFRSSPTVYNDNYLLTIGARRCRLSEDAELSMDSGKRKQKPSMEGLLAHPSQLIVESILYNPSGAPVSTGSINPYLEIDADGNIIRPAIADEIEHVFD